MYETKNELQRTGNGRYTEKNINEIKCYDISASHKPLSVVHIIIVGNANYLSFD